MGSRNLRELLRDELHASKVPTLKNLLLSHFSIFASKDRNIYPAVHNEYSVRYNIYIALVKFKLFSLTNSFALYGLISWNKLKGTNMKSK